MPNSSPQQRRFAIGVDYGTNSVRAIVVDLADGSETASCVYDYPSGEAGVLLDPKDPHLARQNPADYIDGFIARWAGPFGPPGGSAAFGPSTSWASASIRPARRPSRSIAKATPLALHPEFCGNLAAHAWLWKDHTSFAEAAEITEKARRRRRTLSRQVRRRL